MKKLPLTFLIIGLTAALSQADIIFVDSFDPYTLGTLGGQGGWSGSNTLARVQRGVTFNGSNSVQLVTQGGSNWSNYSTQTLSTPVTSNAIYISFLVRGSGINNDSDDVSIAFNSGQMRVGFSYDKGSPVVYAMADSGSMNYVTYNTTNNSTNYVIAKLWKSTTGTSSYYDRFTMWLNPQFLTEAANGAGVTSVGSNDMVSSITSLSLWGDLTTSGKSVTFDNIKLATTFSEAIPEPATIGLLLAGAGALILVRMKMRKNRNNGKK